MNPDENENDDQLRQEQLIINTLVPYCNENSEFEDLRSIGRALQNGDDKLICKLLPGGKTNYPYKVYLEKATPHEAVFVKLAFPYALWSIDKSVPYSLDRTENEYILMKRFKSLFEEAEEEGEAPVATPYLCVDVDDRVTNEKKKLLVTEWAHNADEEFAKQFADGVVDRRVMTKLAKSFAMLNLVKDFDPNFNTDVRTPFRSAEPQMVELFGNLINNNNNNDDDDFIILGRQIGTEGFSQLIEEMDMEYMQRDTLVHGDAHPFNCLVEQRTANNDGGDNSSSKYKFGEKGNVYICDYEMGFAGPIGQDPGKMQGWPIACALYHAIHGRADVANDLIESVHEFWDAYSAVLVERGGVDEVHLAKVYRSSIGWAAYFFVFVFYMLGIFVDRLPVDGLSEVQKKKAKGALGALGLVLLEYGFRGKDPDLDLQGLRRLFRSILAREVDKLLVFPKQDPLSDSSTLNNLPS